MRRTTLAAAWLAVTAAWATPAFCNDSTAELGAGGLQLVRTDDVELLSEDLFVSPTDIRITYRFRNKTDKPVTLLIAFPLPAIDATVPEDLNVMLPKPDAENFVEFAVTVDGQPVTTSTYQRVTALGIDRTADVKALGLPLNPYAEGVDDRIKNLPADKRAELNRLGLIVLDSDNPQAAWKLETAFHWQQTFPPGREIVIEHRYKPVVGFALFGTANLAEDSDYATAYCFEDAFIRSAKAKLNAVKNKPTPYLDEQRVDYILSTARNWSGPIKSFRLVVDNGDADALLSTCMEGLEKISPTQFEFKASDFVPERELELLILRTHKEQ